MTGQSPRGVCSLRGTTGSAVGNGHKRQTRSPLVPALLTGSIARRLYGLLFLFAIGFAGIVTYQLVNLRSNLDSFKRTELQSVVQAAVSLVQGYYDKVQAGT